MGADRRAGPIDRRRGAADFNRFGQRADLHRHWNFHGLAQPHLHVRAIDWIESGELRVHGVRPGRQEWNRVSAIVVGDGRLVTLRTFYRYGHAGHCQALRVRDAAGDHAGRVLGCRSGRRDRTHEYCEREHQ